MNITATIIILLGMIIICGIIYLLLIYPKNNTSQTKYTGIAVIGILLLVTIVGLMNLSKNPAINPPVPTPTPTPTPTPPAAIDCTYIGGTWTNSSICFLNGTQYQTQNPGIPAANGGAVCGVAPTRLVSCNNTFPPPGTIIHIYTRKLASVTLEGAIEMVDESVEESALASFPISLYANQTLLSSCTTAGCSSQYVVQATDSNLIHFTLSSNGFTSTLTLTNVNGVAQLSTTFQGGYQLSIDTFPVIDCTFTDTWVDSGACDPTTGTKKQTKKSTLPSDSVYICGNAPVQTVPCSVDCAYSNVWVDSSTCDLSTGKKTQIKNISQPALNGGLPCGAIPTQSVNCSVDCSYTGVWYDTSLCNPVTNTKTQAQHILHPALNGGAACGPIPTQTVSCGATACSYTGVWVDSGTCDPTTGLKTQIQNIGTPAGPGGAACGPVPTQKVPCAVNCQYTGIWVDSSTCNPATGTKTQNQNVLYYGKNGGTDCGSVPSQIIPCSSDCSYTGGAFINTGTCDKTTGKQLQTQQVVYPAFNGGKVCGTAPTQYVSCGAIDCSYAGGAWTDVSTCDPVTGTKTQVQSIAQPALNGGKACGVAPTQKVSCSSDCTYTGGEWVNTGTCDPNTGLQLQTQKVAYQAINGGAACGVAPTKTIPCVVNCSYTGTWVDVSGCDPLTGTKLQTQTTISAKNGGLVCGPAPMQYVPCASDCQYGGKWFEVGGCVGGLQTQTQEVLIPARNGGACGAAPTRTIPCGTGCYYTGIWVDVSGCQPDGYKLQTQVLASPPPAGVTCTAPTQRVRDGCYPAIILKIFPDKSTDVDASGVVDYNLSTPITIDVSGNIITQTTKSYSVNVTGGSNAANLRYLWTGDLGPNVSKITFGSPTSNATTITGTMIGGVTPKNTNVYCTVTDTVANYTATISYVVHWLISYSPLAATIYPTTLVAHPSTSTGNTRQITDNFTINVTGGSGVNLTYTWILPNSKTTNINGVFSGNSSGSILSSNISNVAGVVPGDKLSFVDTLQCTITDTTAGGNSAPFTTTVTATITWLTNYRPMILVFPSYNLNATYVPLTTNQQQVSQSVAVTGGSGNYTYSWTLTGGNVSSYVAPATASTNIIATMNSSGSASTSTLLCTVTDTAANYVETNLLSYDTTGNAITGTSMYINWLPILQALTATISPNSSTATGTITQTTGTYTVTASGGSGNFSYAWTTSGGNVSAVYASANTASSTSFTGTVTGGASTSTITCTVTDNNSGKTVAPTAFINWITPTVSGTSTSYGSTTYWNYTIISPGVIRQWGYTGTGYGTFSFCNYPFPFKTISSQSVTSCNIGWFSTNYGVGGNYHIDNTGFGVDSNGGSGSKCNVNFDVTGTY